MGVIANLGHHFHQTTFTGLHHIPSEGPALLVGIHTTHNLDVPLIIAEGTELTKRVPRALLHRSSDCIRWLSRRFGAVPGRKAVALDILRAGHIVACLPGCVNVLEQDLRKLKRMLSIARRP